MGSSIWINWGFTILSILLLGGSIMMMVKGTMPPPLTRLRAHPIVATGVFVAGLTLLLVYGTADLLQVTIETLFGA